MGISFQILCEYVPIGSAKSMCPFSKTASPLHGPVPKRAWKPALGLESGVEALLWRMGTSQKLPE